MKKTIAFLLIMILVLCLSSCGGGNNTQNDTNGDTQKEEKDLPKIPMVEYSLADLNFSLPEGWVVDEEANLDEYKRYYCSEGGIKIGKVNVNTTTEFLSDTYLTLDQASALYGKLYVSILESSHKDSEVNMDSEETTTIGELKAVEYKYSIKSKDNNQIYNILLVEKGDIVYTLIVDITTDKYKDYERVYQLIYDSIK